MGIRCKAGSKVRWGKRLATLPHNCMAQAWSSPTKHSPKLGLELNFLIDVSIDCEVKSWLRKFIQKLGNFFQICSATRNILSLNHSSSRFLTVHSKDLPAAESNASQGELLREFHSRSSHCCVNGWVCCLRHVLLLASFLSVCISCWFYVMAPGSTIPFGSPGFHPSSEVKYFCKQCS